MDRARENINQQQSLTIAWKMVCYRVSILLSNLTGRDGDELAVQRCKRQLVAYIIPPVGKQEGEGNSEDHVSFIISVVMMG